MLADLCSRCYLSIGHALVLPEVTAPSYNGGQWQHSDGPIYYESRTSLYPLFTFGKRKTELASVPLPPRNKVVEAASPWRPLPRCTLCDKLELLAAHEVSLDYIASACATTYVCHSFHTESWNVLCWLLTSITGVKHFSLPLHVPNLSSAQKKTFATTHWQMPADTCATVVVLYKLCGILYAGHSATISWWHLIGNVLLIQLQLAGAQTFHYWYSPATTSFLWFKKMRTYLDTVQQKYVTNTSKYIYCSPPTVYNPPNNGRHYSA